ncbi:MAG: phospholipase D family protein [Thermodesulfobacteriota bacterium]|nr:phospholipase D family protein [Thermodesulfobacteriota bacterium]
MNVFRLNHFLTVLCILFLAGGCASLPPNTTSHKSYALQDTTDTRLGVKYDELKKGHSDTSGFIPLGNGLDAFMARALMAQNADLTIDAQYYMIHNDLTGLLFAEQLLKAADRGVQLRILIDDMDLEGRDEGLSCIAGHPNIAVRIFNPFNRQTSRLGQLLTGFGSVTRRMHNKSFTVDNQITIVGGRNIGDEYFDADPAFAFADLDLMAIGPVVKEVSVSFDEYWNNPMAYPIDVLRPDLTHLITVEEGRKKLTESLTRDSVVTYKQSLANSGIVNLIQNNELVYTWGQGRVLSDHPDKLASYDVDPDNTLSSQLTPFLKDVDRDLLIFSPYFVPGKQGTKALGDLSKSGVRVRILTNSLASTDVGVVHAGYAKYRRALLRAGVELYEMNTVISKEQRKGKKGIHGSSKASLHAKSFVMDRAEIFVGSLNFDPRSVVENTEIGIMVSSEDLANTAAKAFDHITKVMAFRLELQTDDEGFETIIWHGMENGEKRIWQADPHTSFWQRFGIGFLSLLPIESQL